MSVLVRYSARQSDMMRRQKNRMSDRPLLQPLLPPLLLIVLHRAGMRWRRNALGNADMFSGCGCRGRRER